MKVVKNTKTNRLIYRQQPDFSPGLGILNALALDLGPKKDLTEIDATPAQWQAEIALRLLEEPPTLQSQIDNLAQRISTIEKSHD
jgi:hypothetical protein